MKTKALIFSILLALALMRPQKVVIQAPDTTYHLTYCDFNGFLQTNKPEIYMRKVEDGYQVVIASKQYDAVLVGTDTLRIVKPIEIKKNEYGKDKN